MTHRLLVAPWKCVIAPWSNAKVAMSAFTLLTAGSAFTAANAQHASDNPVATADDAFGLTIGLESIGLYFAGNVRGFSPEVAGNVRIDGLYFDQQGALSNRVVEGSTIRIGVSEIGYAFPAPTGIVDYDLRHTGKDTPNATVVASAGAFEARGLSIDGKLALLSNELQVPMGASYQISTATNLGVNRGYTSRVVGFGATPKWTPNDRVTVRAIIDWQQTTHAKTLPLVFTAGDFLPPLVQGYVGQNWAEARSLSQNYGGIITARLSQRWSLAAGIFRSISDNPVGYSDLYLDTQRNGLAEQFVVGYPDQSVASTSGEARLTGRFSAGSWRHDIVLLARGRDALALYGGSDAVDVGPAQIGQGLQVPQPLFSYSARTNDRTELWSAGSAYRAQWQGRADFSLGIQQESYNKVVTSPGASQTRLTDRPLRAYATAALTLTETLTAYGGYTQGLEDSGTAPPGAENRGAILPAARTWQVDTGIRYLLTPQLKLIAGVFEIQKPYFNLDTSSIDRELGVQRAKGVEVSISGKLTEQLNVTAGVLTGEVRIIGPDLLAQGVGSIAVGQPRLLFQINADYRIPRWPALSIDLSVSHFGATPAVVNNAVYTQPQTQVNVGGRYGFTVAGHPATLRVSFQDVNRSNVWLIGNNPGFFQFQGPALLGYLTADF
jgi:iron complex outermembrane receptor protein